MAFTPLSYLVSRCITLLLHTRQQEKANKRIGSDESGKEGEEKREKLCFLGFVCKRHIRLHALVEDGWMDGVSIYTADRHGSRHWGNPLGRRTVKKGLGRMAAKQQLLQTTKESRTQRHWEGGKNKINKCQGCMEEHAGLACQEKKKSGVVPWCWKRTQQQRI